MWERKIKVEEVDVGKEKGKTERRKIKKRESKSERKRGGWSYR